MIIALVCSHGGHLTEILQLMDAFESHEVFFITYESQRSAELEKRYTIKNLGKNPYRFLACCPKIAWILIREHPDLIISTGSEIAIPVFYIAWILGIRTMFIESLCRVKELSLTGKIVYPIADKFLVQWEELQGKHGKKAQYWGKVL